MTGRSPRQTYWGGGIAAAVVAAAVIIWWHESSQVAQKSAPPSIPVTITEAAQSDVPIYYHALGTVSALNTVAIRAQVTGQILMMLSVLAAVIGLLILAFRH